MHPWFLLICSAITIGVNCVTVVILFRMHRSYRRQADALEQAKREGKLT